jgi:hypothetical protein
MYAQTSIDRKITEIRRAQAEAEDPLAICLLEIAIESLTSGEHLLSPADWSTADAISQG